MTKKLEYIYNEDRTHFMENEWRTPRARGRAARRTNGNRTDRQKFSPPDQNFCVLAKKLFV